MSGGLGWGLVVVGGGEVLLDQRNVSVDLSRADLAASEPLHMQRQPDVRPARPAQHLAGVGDADVCCLRERCGGEFCHASNFAECKDFGKA